MAGSSLSQHKGREQRSPLISLAFCGVAYWVIQQRMPIIDKSVIDLIGGFACLALVVNGALCLSALLWYLADYVIDMLRLKEKIFSAVRYNFLHRVPADTSRPEAASACLSRCDK